MNGYNVSSGMNDLKKDKFAYSFHHLKTETKPEYTYVCLYTYAIIIFL